VTTPDLIEECLAALGAEVGVPLVLDEQGLCALEHGDGFVFTLIAPDGGELVHLSSRLMDVPAQGREAFLARLLRMNFLLMETSGATLSIDEEEQGVFLCLALLRAQLSADRLLVIIGNFLASSSQLRQRLLAPAGGDDGSHPGHALSSGWLAA
jgi:hypothetical protein